MFYHFIFCWKTFSILNPSLLAWCPSQAFFVMWRDAPCAILKNGSEEDNCWPEFFFHKEEWHVSLEKQGLTEADSNINCIGRKSCDWVNMRFPLTSWSCIPVNVDSSTIQSLLKSEHPLQFRFRYKTTMKNNDQPENCQLSGVTFLNQTDLAQVLFRVHLTWYTNRSPWTKLNP